MVKQKTKIILPIVFLLLIISILGILWRINLLNKNPGSDIQLSSGPSENSKLNSIVNNLSISDNKEIEKGLNLIRGGNYKDSIKKLEGLLKNSKNHDETLGLSILLAHAYLNNGTASYNEIEYAKKTRELLESSNIPKDSWYYLFYVGYSYEIERDYKKSLLFYDKSISFSINNKLKSKTYNQIGHLYDLDGYFNKASEFYLKAIKTDNTNIQANLNLARIYARKQEFKKAISYLENILPKTKDVFLKAEINFNLSSIYMYLKGDKIKNFQKSIDYAQKAIDINPEYPLGYVGVARILISLNINLEHAEKLLKESLKINPNLSLGYEWLGRLEQTKNNFEKSIKYFKKSITVMEKDITLMKSELNENKATIYYYISSSYAFSGDKENTLKYINLFLDYPNFLPLAFFKKETEEKNYGIFSLLKGNKEFENILKGERKK